MFISFSPQNIEAKSTVPHPTISKKIAIEEQTFIIFLSKLNG